MDNRVAFLRHLWQAGAFCSLLVCLASELPAQTDTTPPAFDDVQVVIEPTTCPMNLLPGFTGLIFGFPHAGHTWSVLWKRNTPADSYAGYVPSTGRNLTSRDGEAIWYNAQIFVECTAEKKYFMGRLVYVLDRYRVVETFGRVEDIGCADSSTDLNPYDSDYDPYTYDTSSGTCTGGSGGGSSDPGDGLTDPEAPINVGVQPPGGHEVCGGSTDLYYDYMCIEEWNGEEWVSVWCGVVAVCNSYGS